MLSANFKISHLLYKGLTDGLVWWLCIGAEVELDNSSEIWYSYVKMSQCLNPCLVVGSGVESQASRSRGVGSKTFFWKMRQMYMG